MFKPAIVKPTLVTHTLVIFGAFKILPFRLIIEKTKHTRSDTNFNHDRGYGNRFPFLVRKWTIMIVIICPENYFRNVQCIVE